MFSERYYRPDEIATVLGVSKKTVYRMINDVNDPLPAYRPAGKQLRVHGRDLNAYMDKRKVKPEEE